jgi:hypothetical protein
MSTVPEGDDIEALIAGEMTAFDPGNRYGTSAPLGATIINWRTLTDTDARKAWDALRGWVNWFTARYRIPESTVPACWYKHGHLVEELSALHTAHTAAFDASDAGFGPIGWHERLSLALPRLTRAYAGGCSDAHQDRISRPPAPVDEQDWDAWTTQAHAHRDTPVPHNRKEHP